MLATCCLETQTVAPTLTGFQAIKRCVNYFYSHPNKPNFYPSNSCNGSNIIKFTWIGNQVEDYTTQNFLECHQDADHAISINIIQSVLGILHTLIGVSIFRKTHIQPYIESNCTYG